MAKKREEKKTLKIVYDFVLLLIQRSAYKCSFEHEFRASHLSFFFLLIFKTLFAFPLRHIRDTCVM